jgi:hypothetical protein
MRAYSPAREKEKMQTGGTWLSELCTNLAGSSKFKKVAVCLGQEACQKSVISQLHSAVNLQLFFFCTAQQMEIDLASNQIFATSQKVATYRHH